MRLRTALLAAAAMLAAPAAHASVLIDFDGVTTYAEVDSFYAGGTDSLGASGPNLGVTFSNFATTTGFGETSGPNLAYNSDLTATIDTTFGFTGLSFAYGFFAPGDVSVYSGLDGTGTLLGTFHSDYQDPGAFAPGSVLFSGLGKSVVISGGAAQLGFDDVTFTTASFSPAPEPSTWAMLAIGFAGLAFAARRASKAHSAVNA